MEQERRSRSWKKGPHIAQFLGEVNRFEGAGRAVTSSHEELDKSDIIGGAWAVEPSATQSASAHSRHPVWQMPELDAGWDPDLVDQIYTILNDNKLAESRQMEKTE